jgi:hypothetical protein
MGFAGIRYSDFAEIKKLTEQTWVVMTQVISSSTKAQRH